ncbi:hypothetical protein K438DRAFT_1975736 [Mycena galopus ATCC 62051]|nr:hypothetical protein K438DRAFT_1975736 [Mycena galopus ATCC 62051]
MRFCPLPSASPPMPKRSAPHPTVPGLTGQMLKQVPPSPAAYFMHPHFVLCRGSLCWERIRWIFGMAAAQHSNTCAVPNLELILCLDRASNDVSVCPGRSPMGGPLTHVALWCRREVRAASFLRRL